MIFNIITPLARFENFNKLIKHLAPKKVIWHVIIDDDSNYDLTINKEWIKVYICPNSGMNFWERCNNSINWFINNHRLADEEYYGILNDDDGYENNFFKKLKQSINKSHKEGINTDLVICSMLRGDQIPKDAIFPRNHPTHPLLAEPKYMQVGSVGVEQFFIKGRILKNHNLPLTTAGDGELICELVSKYEVLYLPEIFVWFNYFEPGRWNKKINFIDLILNMIKSKIN